MFVLTNITVNSQPPELSNQFGIVGGHHATIARTAEILRREEAEAADVAEDSCAATLVFGTDRLASVFNDLQPILLRLKDPSGLMSFFGAWKGET